VKITFILPGSSRVPFGGYKVVFEYANCLSERGHAVTIVHPAHLDETAPWKEKLYHNARYLLWGATRDFGPRRWFKLRPEVKTTWVHSLREANIPPGDAIVATGWPTAEYVATYSPDKGRKFYLLQHYETWWGPEERVRATWQLPLHKIVIARWLEDIATELGQPSTYIPNGLDFLAFGCDLPIRERRRPHVLMLSHVMEWKGTADGLKALEFARRSVPELTATLFGVAAPPANLPAWISYERNPPQARLRQLYNDAAVFLAPSLAEGWPLPPAEAMMCGAALVCTDIGGHREYAVHERNALLAPPRSPLELGAALLRMLTDDALRQRLAEQALADIGRFTWKAATDRFEATLSASGPLSSTAKQI
jgi:glycosyltransferase involved in cell wall biosynthesis